MGNSLQAAADRDDRSTDIVKPREHIETIQKNPAGLAASKLLALLTQAAGPRMAEVRSHSIKVADLNTAGLGHHTEETLSDLMDELHETIIERHNRTTKKIYKSGLIERSTIDYSDDKTGQLEITWTFGHDFRMLAKHSDHWALLDRATALNMRSRYSLALYECLSLHFRRKRTSKTFTVDQLRNALHVEKGRHARFTNLHNRALKPAIEEVSEKSAWALTYALKRSGKHVTEVTIWWTEKPPVEKTRTKAELDRHSVGRKHRQAGTAERVAEHPPFPDNPKMFRYSDFWVQIYHDAGCRAEMTSTAQGFLNWTAKNKKPRSPKVFYSFCKGENARKDIR